MHRLAENISLIQRENRELKWILELRLGPLLPEREEPSVMSYFNCLIPLEQVQETLISSLSRSALILICVYKMIYHEIRLSRCRYINPFPFIPPILCYSRLPRLSKSRALRAPRRARDVPQCCDA